MFQRMWTDHPDFVNTVAMDWKRPTNGSPAMVLHAKLSRLKKTLLGWNWNTYGNVHSQKLVVQEKFKRLDLQLQQGWSEISFREWEETYKEMHQVEAWENEWMCNKVRLDWTKERDRNSKFSHAAIGVDVRSN